jgi:hypothetical protein
VIFTSPTTQTASNTTIYTAANGDQLFSEWSGTSTSTGPDVAFSASPPRGSGCSRRTSVSASRSIRAGAARAPVKLLDRMAVRYRFERELQLLAAWDRAKRAWGAGPLAQPLPQLQAPRP